MEDREDMAANAELIFQFEEKNVEIFCLPSELYIVRLNGIIMMPPRTLDVVNNYLFEEVF